MGFIERAALLILTPQCYDNYFIKQNLLNGPCFKATLSKCLGLVLILGSILVKVPQIIKILKSKSGEGISIISIILDLSAITIYASYNFLKQFPFSSWGDSAFLAIQTFIIGVLVLVYSNKQVPAAIFSAIYSTILFIFLSGITPVSVLWTLQGFNIPILLAGKLTQAYVNYKNGHTGQLSAITVIMLFGGSLARIFTSIQETGDSMVIITCMASAFANTVVVVQLIYYWKVDVEKLKHE